MSARIWPGARPVDGSIRIPGSKSYTNRALIIASLASGESVLEGVSVSDDSVGLVEALRTLGVAIESAAADLVVTGSARGSPVTDTVLDLGPAGTSYRFLLPLCALASGSRITLTGSARMRERPIGDLVETLRSMGASIEELGSPGCPPLRISGVDRLRGGAVAISGRTSSQFVSALLMIAPLLDEGLTLEIVDDLTSESYVEMTCECMAAFGVPVLRAGNTFRVEPGSYRPRTHAIDGDASGASYFWGLAAVSRGRVRVENLVPDSPQGDLRFPKILEEMGCAVRRGDDQGSGWIEVTATSALRGVDVDMSNLPDTAQTLAVIASVAKGKTRICGLGTLPHKETDRLHALRTELARVGIDSEITANSIQISGGTPKLARVHTYGDHRMAMSFALLGAQGEGIEIDEPEVVTKSFPSFWRSIEALGVNIDGG